MEGTSPLKVMIRTREKWCTGLSRYERDEWAIEGNMDESIHGGSPLDTPDEAILPKEFSRISPSKPRERRRKAQLREGY